MQFLKLKIIALLFQILVNGKFIFLSMNQVISVISAKKSKHSASHL